MHRTVRPIPRPLKLLLVSGLHHAVKPYDWTIAAARDLDAMVIEGDHLDIAASVDGTVQVVVIRK